MDYSQFEMATQKLIDLNNSITLPKLFWFYYYCSHLVLNGNITKFIINYCNCKLQDFTFHWSFTVRQVFYKLILFIYNERINDEEGKLFDFNIFYNFINNTREYNYGKEAKKDYDTIYKEYISWKKTNNNSIDSSKISYPSYYLPLINADNAKID